LKKSISLYLKSKKLKKRNANYKSVYQRICEELKYREVIGNEYSELGVKTRASTSETTGRKGSSTSNDDGLDRSMLGRKTSSKFSIHDLHIPSFFNDKNTKVAAAVTLTKGKGVEGTIEVEKPVFNCSLFNGM
jgi:hypothetical protein